MRQEEACDGGCSERKLELVSGDDYDELAAAAADCRARVQGLRAVAGELARTEPGPGEWQAAYEALQRSARAALRRYRPAPDGTGGPGPGGQARRHGRHGRSASGRRDRDRVALPGLRQR